MPNEYDELQRQISISGAETTEEVKKIYLRTVTKCLIRDITFQEDEKWSEAIDALPNSEKILSLNSMIIEIMIDIYKRARWNCWIDGKLIKN